MGTQILVIDDYQDGANVLRDLLELQGHAVTAVYGGAEGIVAARETTPKVALVDIGMPGMDGYEVARILRSEMRDEIYLVAITAWSDHETKQRCYNSGFDLHMSKPVDFLSLFDVVSRK